MKQHTRNKAQAILKKQIGIYTEADKENRSQPIEQIKKKIH